ncbi:helix-turn-helix transcriptional regulator [Halodesulfovibrio sp. MK-HDV]|jgi:AraC family transcriptional regulator, transcriptional activator of pobA|uniref:AraC family transcriptional regulator n=1 Tax=unclassified Halodesulfovibrio TaxID=2644657 RepID=UPI00136D8E81|nr:helix-turn-helix transcriptional regulator [Halodesulfovibrio sp. MK-HDV]KAF1076988.1 HTH-type transcriptional activator RhaS [Halodesulfovibrio sp. MK-HDV]
MNKIPQISFRKPTKSTLEFEIFTLQKLFSRRPSLKPSIENPHRVNFYHILFITKGTGQHQIDFTTYNYQKGSIIFIAPSQVHAFTIKKDVEGFIIIFTESFILKNLGQAELLHFARSYNYHSNYPIVEGTSSEKNMLLQSINEMYEEYCQPIGLMTEEILRLQLKLLLLKIERIKNTDPKNKNSSEWENLFAAFRKNLELNYTETRNATDYAAMLNISYKHLNTVCKAMSGCTAKEFIDAYIVLEIKRHIAMFTLSTKELAFNIGFDEPTNLIKFFKRHAHQTPQQFKSTLLG